uniref:Fidgetin-like protein 1 n=1 Tax=Cajanus cajan TaxID=3821 RepID=A0A151TMX6_CAJCA|nr:Fidgetin-like protein 1 [Cajanus cajan]
MYLRRIQCRDRTWALVLQPSKYFFRPRFYDHPYFQSFLCLNGTQLRSYSSEGDGRNASEDNHVHVSDGANFDKGENQKEKFGKDIEHCNAHTRLGEQEQEEWLNNEKLSIESKKRESPFLTRRDKFKNEFMRRIIPWEKINISWETFPYHINEHSKNLLVECAASHLRQNKFASSFGTHLPSSSGRILLQSIPGTELYRERLVRALAQDLQVPLLVLDNSILAAYDIDDDLSSDYDSDEDNAESGEEGSLESENEVDNDASNEEEWASSTEAKSDASDNEDAIASAEAHLKKVKAAVLRKLVPYNVEEFEKIVSGESESSESSKSNDAESSDKCECQLKKGDRVKYIGPSVQVTDEDRIILGKILTSDGPTSAYTIIHGRPLAKGQRGEVYEVNGDRVAVILDINEDKVKEGEAENLNDDRTKPPIYWIHVKDIENDLDAQSQDCYIAVEALCEVLHCKQPLIVYFPDSSQWLHKSVPKSNRNEFFRKVEEMFDRLSGPIVLICGQNKVQSGSKEKEQFTMILPNFGRVAKLPLSLKRWTEGIKGDKTSDDDEINKLFSNVLSIHPPKDENLLVTFKKQLEEDKKIVTSRSNLNVLRKVLEEHQLSCMDLLHVNTDGIILTKHKPCKGILLFGPPGTGKTLLAKALATEAGANFISITGSTLTSKWFGDAEKLTKALFSFASKLAPVIIFVDEVDSLLGARGGAFEHEATRRMRNEFMAAWDGLRSKENQRILILGATNRPFDLDDAVIRRLPRRIYVDLPDAENRMKILRIFLAQENLDSNFQFDKLANLTDGYSGSDLKNLCIAAAYRPVQELLEEEKKGASEGTTSVLRPLNVDDFIQAKSKVGPSVAYDATSMNELRKWNEMYGEGGSRTKSPFGFGT